MSLELQEVTAETIVTLIEQMPSTERSRLDKLLAERKPDPPKTKPPLDKRMSPQPMPDRTKELEWVEQHKHEYAGQWVALDGARLIAASSNRSDISVAIKAGGAILPLILRIPSPDDLPYIGI
ncbi:MAG: hypothetical protein SF097_08940 [Acidobacteriota bacterium]|nr:hypothetical protein [Acidobacteriota bacterium]